MPKLMICGSGVGSCDHLVVWGEAPEVSFHRRRLAFERRAQASSRLAEGHRRRRRAAALTGRARRYPWPRGDDAGPCRVVAFTADHQFPGDARQLVGERHGGEFRRLARHQIAQPGRGMSLALVDLLDDRGGARSRRPAGRGL
jgi:hypothetical protein